MPRPTLNHTTTTNSDGTLFFFLQTSQACFPRAFAKSSDAVEMDVSSAAMEHSVALPQELIDLTLENLRGYHTALVACCSVSRLWLPTARRYLLEWISVSPSPGRSRSSPPFISWQGFVVQLKQSPHIFQHILTLYMSTPEFPWNLSLDAALLNNILLAAPHLHSLYLDNIACTPTPTTGVSFQATQKRHLRYLMISDVHAIESPLYLTVDAFNEIFGLFASVDQLVMRNIHHFDTEVLQSATPPLSFPTIRSLKRYGLSPPIPKDYHRALMHSSHTLESLSIQIFYFGDDSPQFAALLSSCTVLTQLELDLTSALLQWQLIEGHEEALSTSYFFSSHCKSFD